MNRQIKFRGKHIKTGEWLYGSHYDDGGEDYILENLPNSALDFEERQIDQNTLGQFTGLHDKDGQEIYEGDILRSSSGNIVAVEFGYKEHIVKHGRPYITDSFACYGWIARNAKNGITDFFDNEFAAGEVVGNIHDPKPRKADIRPTDSGKEYYKPQGRPEASSSATGEREKDAEDGTPSVKLAEPTRENGKAHDGIVQVTVRNGIGFQTRQFINNDYPAG